MKSLVVICASALAVVALMPVSAGAWTDGGIATQDDWESSTFLINPKDPNGDANCTGHGWTVSKDAQGNKICANPAVAPAAAKNCAKPGTSGGPQFSKGTECHA